MSEAVAEKRVFFRGTGRRKRSVAQVRVYSGTGKIAVNRREFGEYFVRVQDRAIALAPLTEVKRTADLDLIVKVEGGGIAGQAGATCLGVARALIKMDSEFEPILRRAGHLTRDSRMKERKKYGLRGARRGFQFSKR